MQDVTIIIYPFEQLFGSEERGFTTSFFADLVTELSRFRQFRIVTNDSIPDDGSLHPDYSIKGLFRFSREKVRINGQLINNRNGRVVWADSFEEDTSSIDMKQEAIIKQMVSSTHLQLDHDLLSRIRKTPTNFSAYGHWLMGMKELKKGSLEADEIAREHFRKAIQADPSFSLGYSGMSLSYFNEWSCQLWERWQVSQHGAGEWAKKAIDLDEDNHIAALVLGRVYLYDAEYEIAENYLRRALKLNIHDNDNLIEIASCFVYLGLTVEAEEIYNRVIATRPYQNKYNNVGAQIAFEQGDFSKCVDLAANARNAWVDFPAMKAAAYFELGDMESMKTHWLEYLDGYRQKIQKGSEADALQWVINVSPFKINTKQRRFWEFIGGKQTTPSPRVFMRPVPVDPENFFLKEGDVWQLSFEGVTIRMAEIKGLNDLATLLAKPEKSFHCTELIGGGIVSQPEKMFDEKARRSYQKRIKELQEEIRDSEDNNDSQRSVFLHEEYEGIVDHLRSSLGLNGSVRAVSDSLEKTRSAVTWRIRSTIQKIEKHHPALGRHLSASIKTGLFCSYKPEKPMKWVVSDR